FFLLHQHGSRDSDNIRDQPVITFFELLCERERLQPQLFRMCIAVSRESTFCGIFQRVPLIAELTHFNFSLAGNLYSYSHFLNRSNWDFFRVFFETVIQAFIKATKRSSVPSRHSERFNRPT